MKGLGILVAWVAWTGILWGFCLYRDYNVTLKDLVTPQTKIVWPPKNTIPTSQVFPTQGAGVVPATQGSSGQTSGLTPGTGGVGQGSGGGGGSSF